VNKIETIKNLTAKLLQYCDEYYNLDRPTISDTEYDKKFDELKSLEDKTGFWLANSPTRKVQGQVLDCFTKVKHSKPMLSAAKTKDVNEIKRFIGNQPFYCSYKLDGCFTSSCKISMADGTYKNINKIQIGDFVLSCSPDGIVQPKRVSNVFYNGLKKQEEWMTIYTEKGVPKCIDKDDPSYGGTKCTKNHMFFTPNGYIEAQKLKSGDIIYKQYHTPSKIQQQAILGMLLGDGWFVKRSNTYSDVLEIHTSKTKNNGYDDIIYKFEKMFKTFNPKITHKTSGYSKVKNNMTNINFHTMALPNYFNDNKNHIRCGITWTDEILSHMTNLSWAIFFIDDGSLVKSQEEGKNVTNKIAGAILHTNRHPYENVKILSDYLNNIGLFNYIELEKPIVNEELGDGYIIRISQDSSMKFFSMIAPYIPRELRAKKLPNRTDIQECEEIKWWENDDSYIGLSEEKIYKITIPSPQREHSLKAYDIEVEDNHNYFANNHLVHNCTLVVRYENGEFVQAVTRGNGEIGEDVTAQAKMITNLPMHIDYNDKLELRGECVISWKNFHKINESLDEPYSHPRNLAAGSLRQLDTNITKQRNLSYVVFECVSDLYDNNALFDSKLDELGYLDCLGFETVGRCTGNVDDCIEGMQPEWYQYPCDGLIFEMCMKSYSKTLPVTAHHEGCRMALKWADEMYETTLRDVEWNPTRSGLIAPVAIFDEIDLDGALTTRATLHNLSIIEQLELGIGDTITVYRSNMVIPKVYDNLTRSNTLTIPTTCPCCGEPTEIKYTDNSKVLMCTNPNCAAKKLAQFTHFVSRKAMNIDGLSEKTLELLISHGFLHNYKDIYHLKEYKNKITQLPGMGAKSVDKLLDSIEKSRAVTLDRFITALGIPNIGSSAAKAISKQFNGDHYDFVQALANGYDFSQIDDFGEITNKSLHDWWDSKDPMAELLPVEMNFIVENDVGSSSNLDGKSFCITGSLTHYPNRDALVKAIEDNGGKYVSGVSKKTDYLINNDTTSTSGKNKKAVELNIPIISEEDFLKMLSE
jgi:DNA ligase (NAD+)